MSRLATIPVKVEFDAASRTGTIGGGVVAILAEIAAHLDRLAGGGEPGAIDLRGLPLSADDRRRLVEALGEGEARVVLQIDGESTIRETAMPGVWWNEHRDRNGVLTAAYIEIARVPGILPVETGELTSAAADLRARVESRHS
jgi:HupH hydrogenase expression protein, C-terminal conserved region